LSSVGPYFDEVPYDVQPMDDYHVLLDRAWLFENHVTHDKDGNTYALKFKGCSLTLAPLRPPKPLKIKPRKGRDRSLYVCEASVERAIC